MKVRIILKSGYEIPIVCDNFKVNYALDTSISGYEYAGLDIESGCSPLHIDVNEIAAIIQDKVQDN